MCEASLASPSPSFSALSRSERRHRELQLTWNIKTIYFFKVFYFWVNENIYDENVPQFLMGVMMLQFYNYHYWWNVRLKTFQPPVCRLLHCYDIVSRTIWNLQFLRSIKEFHDNDIKSVLLYPSPSHRVLENIKTNSLQKMSIKNGEVVSRQNIKNSIIKKQNDNWLEYFFEMFFTIEIYKQKKERWINLLSKKKQKNLTERFR